MNPDKFIGRIISNYKIINVIGDGAFSTVFLAEEIKSDSKENNLKEEKNGGFKHKNYVACKIIPRTKTTKKKYSKRFDQEIRIQQLMHHPNVVQLIDVQKDPLFYYIFLEFFPCNELFNIVIQKGKLTEYEAAYFFKQLLMGLQYIHSLNIAHRDLKPENILVDKCGRVKIVDFGLSIILSNNSFGFTKTPCGSPCYASPECINGHSYEAKKSDIWSCGVILYTISTGFLPWTKKEHSELFDQIRNGEFVIPSFLSNKCADLIEKMMTVDTYKRISIKGALNHPFLKDIFIPPPKFERKFVSLRKIDRLLDVDADFDYRNEIDHLANSGSNFDNSFFKVRKKIESEDKNKISIK